MRLDDAERKIGDLDAAAGLFDASLQLNRRLGDSGMVAVESHNFGHVELRRGEVDAAERHFVRAEEGADLSDPFVAVVTTLNHACIADARNAPRSCHRTACDGPRRR